MTFPILYKHKRIFIWYSGRWMNLSLEASTHGVGIKGYFRFFYHWIRCIFGAHRIGHFAGFTEDENGKVNGFEGYTACMYCHGLKKVDIDE